MHGLITVEQAENFFQPHGPEVGSILEESPTREAFKGLQSEIG